MPIIYIAFLGCLVFFLPALVPMFTGQLPPHYPSISTVSVLQGTDPALLPPAALS